MTEGAAAPADRLRAALRESGAETPIGEQAAAAVRVRSGAEVFPKPAQRRVITVANQKGGVGKTTSAVNLAVALALHGATVLVIDLDPQGNLTQALGPNPDSLDVSLYNVLVDRVPLEKAILNPVLGRPQLFLVGANLELAAADHQLAGVVAREMRLRQVLEPYFDRFDYILLDCPPALGLLTLNALTAATEVIVPVDAGVFSLRGVAKLMDTISEVRSVNPGLRRIKALSNRTDKTNLATDVQAELERSFGDDLFRTVIRRSVRVGEAQAARSPITVYRPRDPAAVDYFALAEEVKNGA
jgi:chromosome partitioning protein